ncbi:GDSL-type esterase/lipase family protein [Polyangium aurulentum]|uniref:GDSL-type esterase/lipase family protein n=1 Tax=Polyangium aurulentum TaxID=2567896 RepID=UPI001F238356|nr:GDSL-type esterase/lipase family protein [Polyangium aurulentum]
MTRSPDVRSTPRTRRPSLALVAGAACTLALAACSAGQEHAVPHDAAVTPPPQAEPHTAAVAPPPAASQVPMVEPAVPAVATAEPAPAQPPPFAGEPELARFHGALRDLTRGARKSHVRILWLGDSHGQADFWTGGLRTALQKRYGNGGPGFVHMGWKAYRHDGMKLVVDGKWSIRPKAPASSSRVGDGMFGLGGVVAVGPVDGGKARAQVTDEGLSGRMSWDVCYRLRTPSDELSVKLGSRPPTAVRATSTEPAGELRHLVLVGEGPETLEVASARGLPELCGVVIETDPAKQPGVVLDTLGINGARFGTPLAWDETSFGAELVRRQPTLVILEYGTNESGDVGVDPSVYGKKLVRLMERIRRFAPDTDCLALAPTDRADTRERTPLVRDAIRAGALEAGCGFWDTYAVMGGAGSIRAWAQETTPRAARDGVHLTPKGYRELGEALAAHVLRGLSPDLSAVLRGSTP